MLFVIVKTKDKWATKKTWYVGECVPKMDGLNGDRCDFVQADGDELLFIKSRFHNLPIVRGNEVVAWTGDLADFIFRNLE